VPQRSKKARLRSRAFLASFSGGFSLLGPKSQKQILRFAQDDKHRKWYSSHADRRSAG
jgi:hypothetical protein